MVNALDAVYRQVTTLAQMGGARVLESNQVARCRIIELRGVYFHEPKILPVNPSFLHAEMQVLGLGTSRLSPVTFLSPAHRACGWTRSKSFGLTQAGTAFSRYHRGNRMPELPEVETMCRGIKSIEGYRVINVQMTKCDLKPISIVPPVGEILDILKNQRILDVGRLGKRVLVNFENDYSLVIEPRMTGLVMLENPPNTKHLRLEIALKAVEGQERGIPETLGESEKKLMFWDRRGLGTIRLLAGSDLKSQLAQRLGPDALTITAKMYSERFGGRKKEIKVALLDQTLVAGIGNIYAAEILFLAGVDPRSACDRITLAQWERIAQATQTILQTAIEYEGSTLSDGTYRNAINGEGSYQHCHRVYDREGMACTRCELGRIQRLVQGQRSTFFCPVCQRKRGRHASLKAE